MKKLTAIATAAVIAATAAVSTVPAQAAPFNTFAKANIEMTTAGVEKTGKRHRRHRRHRRAAAAAIGLGAFAAGMAIAAGAHARPARTCHIERVRVWKPRLQAYVIRKERVCY